MDVSQFADAHNVHSPAELPAPEGTDYITSFESAILKDNLDSWVGSLPPRNEIIVES